jgi:hypothetical protein
MREDIKELLQPINAWIEEHSSYEVMGFTFCPDEVPDLMMTYFGKSGCEDILISIGATEDGSTYAFWFVEDTPLKQTPIVRLGSGVPLISGKQQDTFVMAQNYRDFLALLAAGYDFVGEDNDLGDFLELDEFCDFREWVLTQGVEAIPDFEGVNAILDQAEAQYPNFTEWLDERRG